MSAIIYIYRGVLILLMLVSTKHREATFQRWKRSQPYKVIFEIGSGVIGLVVIGVLIWMVYSNSIHTSPVQHSRSTEL